MWLLQTLCVGMGATLCMDIWSQVKRHLLGHQTPDFSLVGRWIGHMRRGIFRHEAIKTSPAVEQERILGWLFHYLTGVVFACVLVLACGTAWLQEPSLLPALVFGLVSVVFPFFLMQPAMGLGIAASKASSPAAARWNSVQNHLVFGLGLYLSAILLRLWF